MDPEPRGGGRGEQKYEIFYGHIFMARFTRPEGHVPGPLMLRIALCFIGVFTLSQVETN